MRQDNRDRPIKGAYEVHDNREQGEHTAPPLTQSEEYGAGEDEISKS